MKEVFLVYECDSWMSCSSKELLSVFGDFADAVSFAFDKCTQRGLCTELDTDYEEGKADGDYVLEFLREKSQTPNLNVNYIIEPWEVRTYD